MDLRNGNNNSSELLGDGALVGVCQSETCATIRLDFSILQWITQSNIIYQDLILNYASPAYMAHVCNQHCSCSLRQLSQIGGQSAGGQGQEGKDHERHCGVSRWWTCLYLGPHQQPLLAQHDESMARRNRLGLEAGLSFIDNCWAREKN